MGEKRKFLRLLGGRELADAEVEVISDGELNEARGEAGERDEGYGEAGAMCDDRDEDEDEDEDADDALIDDEDLPTDCPVFEFNAHGELEQAQGAAPSAGLGDGLGGRLSESVAESMWLSGMDVDLPGADQDLQRQ